MPHRRLQQLAARLETHMKEGERIQAEILKRLPADTERPKRAKPPRKKRGQAR